MRRFTAHRFRVITSITVLVVLLLLMPRTLESSARAGWPAALIVIGVWLAAAAASATFILPRAGRGPGAAPSFRRNP
jgi:hypothetical protein